jgi:predicted NUDIX family NTP pyrophosphohydrolase
MQRMPIPGTRSQRSGGVLLFRSGAEGDLEVLLVHPGGPFWAKKDDGVWSIPKGELDGDEDALAAARREFAEETGFTPDGQFIDLGAIKQPGGKVVCVWAVDSDFDPRALVSNSFEMEWPKNSGQMRSFPEVDRAAWLDIATARRKILKGQAGFIDRLINVLGARRSAQQMDD